MHSHLASDTTSLKMQVRITNCLCLNLTCRNRIPETESFIRKENLFPVVQEAGESNSIVLTSDGTFAAALLTYTVV